MTALRAIDGDGYRPPTPDSKGRFTLSPVPELDDVAGLCTWLTSAFNLDPSHPITGGEKMGVRGPEGLVVLRRAEVESIRFEPAKQIDAGRLLRSSLAHQGIVTDGEVPPYKDEHCRHIAFAIKRLCGVSQTLSDEQEAAGIIGTFMQSATAVEGFTTYGTSGERYEAAVALRRAVDEQSGRAIGPACYLIDSNTGEFVIGVSDLNEAARRHVGSSITRGWLPGRMQAFGWQRVTLDGHALPGRDGRTGPHARIQAYRGLLPTGDGDVSVTT